jgi:hypothetical protein
MQTLLNLPRHVAPPYGGFNWVVWYRPETSETPIID